MSNDQIKLAQAELIQQVAEQNGIDVSTMSDHELAKFAGYVLSQMEEPVENEKLAEAEAMGRHMARAYVDEQMKIAQVQEAYTVQEKVAEAMNDAAQYWEIKLADEMEGAMPPSSRGKNGPALGGGETKATGGAARTFGSRAGNLVKDVSGYTNFKSRAALGKIIEGHAAHVPTDATEAAALAKHVEKLKGMRSMELAKGLGKAGLTAAAVGGLGYGAYRLAGGGEKQAAYDLVKEAAEDLKSGDPTRMQQAGAKLKAAGSWVADKAKNYSGYSDIREGLAGRRGADASRILMHGAAENAMADYAAAGINTPMKPDIARFTGLSNEVEQLKSLSNRSLLKGVGKAGLTAAALGAAGYGAYRLAGGGEKKASIAFLDSITPTDFAKLAEARAAEIMAYNGINPETLEACEPTAIKLAGVPMADEVGDWDEKVAANAFNEELNAAALHILSNLGLVNG